ncbi:NAD-dependent epimerase/dehydratase family protein [Streptomyces enissocaesilis]|uniref:NAD-dependent epimerase/dehydratase family protein n=1 Tax=Streptomyces enissocaesilis TaxID=332589 RepID=A0ABN3X7H4_9ACTN
MNDVDVVTGAGGFIGGHLVGELLRQGRQVRAVDVKPFEEWHQLHDDAANTRGDVALLDDARRAVAGAEVVYNLAADMGGMGFIENNKAACMLSVLISTHVLQASQQAGVERYFYSSSACVYAADHQTSTSGPQLREGDAYPAMPEDGYGWEKLFSERMCRHFTDDFGFPTRVARYHNIYGEHGTWRDGREKAPAALCRKVAVAALTGEPDIEIWGDGKQTRSFTYIDDCVEGTLRVARSDDPTPVNLGSDELVSIDEVVDLLEEISGVTVRRNYDTTAPQGVRGRCSENTEIRRRLGWQPSTALSVGLERTYAWVYSQVKQHVA